MAEPVEARAKGAPLDYARGGSIPHHGNEAQRASCSSSEMGVYS